MHWAGAGGFAAAAVASQTRIPTRILVTLGANDVAGTLVEATWKADYLDILDRFHAAWPDAVVYLSRPWVRTPTTNLNTVAGWIADIQAARSTFVELGPDERVWLEGGDDGATNTTDGVHYSAAGQIAAAAAWYAVIPH